MPVVLARHHGNHGGLGGLIEGRRSRFRSRDEVESSLAAYGYRVLDVRDAPDRPGREFEFIAGRTT